MGDFYEDMRAELIDVFYDSDDDTTEEITVKFNNGSTPNRIIKVIVERPAPNSNGETASPRPILHIVNDEDHGITSVELDVGQMTFQVSERPGTTPKDWRARLLDTSSKAELILELL